jgi:hypothetical protein
MWWETLLEWVVIIAPTLFALGIEVIDEKKRKDNEAWRIGVVMFGVALSALTWFQISHAHKAAAKEQEHAIEETSERVSERVSESVSKSVTKSVSEQYENTIKDLNGQIGTLESHLAVQGKQIGQKIEETSYEALVKRHNSIRLEVTQLRFQTEGFKMEHHTHIMAIHEVQAQLEANKKNFGTNSVDANRPDEKHDLEAEDRRCEEEYKRYILPQVESLLV